VNTPIPSVHGRFRAHQARSARPLGNRSKPLGG
jgi:hypothetical protein